MPIKNFIGSIFISLMISVAFVQIVSAAEAIGGSTQCRGLDIVQYDAEKLQAELGDGFELLEEKNEIHVTPSKVEQKFSYFRFVRK
ncbi:MAG: hypothetical protein KAT90_02545 [Gammaproteobacteria bacterium]|nr:hypothetical protein [Gammaproteobacteria bacterium]